MSLLRLNAAPVAPDVLKDWIHRAVSLIFEHSASKEAILFGSALGSRFNGLSDLDFVVVFADEKELKEGQRSLYSKTPLFPCPVDLVCVTREDFDRRSQIGGVLFIAREDGRVFERKSWTPQKA